MHVFLPRLPIRVRTHPQPTLATFPADGPDNGRTIILIGAVTPALVGAAARRIARITVFVAFFPPRSGTSHRFPSHDPARPADLTSCTRWQGGVSATDGCTDARARVPQLLPSRGRLCKRRELTTPRGVVPSYSPQRRSRYRHSTAAGSWRSGNRQRHACACEMHGRVPEWLRSRDSSILWDERISQPRRGFPSHRVTRLWEKSLLTFTMKRTN